MPRVKEAVPGLVQEEANVPMEDAPAEDGSHVDPPTVAPSRLTKDTIGGLKIETVSDIPDFINMMVYGDPGVGKTTLMGSAVDVPELQPVLFIDIEGGVLSLRKKYPSARRVRLKSWVEMQAVYDDLRRGSEFKTVIVDTLTETQKFSMLEIMKQVVAKDSERDSEVPSIREWGKNGEQIRRLVRALRDLPINSFFTAFAAEETTDSGIVTKVKPALSGKLSAEVAGFVDIVAYYYVKIVDGVPQRLLLTASNGKHIVKDRSDNLPAVVIQPTMKTIYNHIFEREQDN
jgi:phage nucleotide-binding protein